MSSKEESLQSMNRRVKNTGQENRKYEQHFACVALKTLQQTKPTPLGFDLLSQKSQCPQRASFFYFFPHILSYSIETVSLWVRSDNRTEQK